jgi:hypothetical protein
MLRFANGILAVVIISLLAMQTSGLHLHANLDSATVDMHGLHAGPAGHEHADDIDVAFFDVGAIWSKFVDILPGMLPAVVAVTWLLLMSRPVPIRVLSLRTRSRWRPPLRAPPERT